MLSRGKPQRGSHRTRGWIVLLVLAWAIGGRLVSAAGNETERVESATKVLNEIMAIPEKNIPPALMQDAYGMAVIPNVIKAGFMVGGRHGKGILVVRNAHGSWSPPVFLTLSGGSVGWQVGVQSSDIILVFRNKSSMDHILEEQFTLGADAAVAAGPVGRHVEAGTDVRLTAAIYSYSRSKGLFVGLALEGAMLQVDHSADEAYYHQEEITPKSIFAGDVPSVPSSAQAFIQTITRYGQQSPREK